MPFLFYLFYILLIPAGAAVKTCVNCFLPATCELVSSIELQSSLSRVFDCPLNWVFNPAQPHLEYVNELAGVVPCMPSTTAAVAIGILSEDHKLPRAVHLDMLVKICCASTAIEEIYEMVTVTLRTGRYGRSRAHKGMDLSTLSSSANSIQLSLQYALIGVGVSGTLPGATLVAASQCLIQLVQSSCGPRTLKVSSGNSWD